MGLSEQESVLGYCDDWRDIKHNKSSICVNWRPVEAPTPVVDIAEGPGKEVPQQEVKCCKNHRIVFTKEDCDICKATGVEALGKTMQEQRLAHQETFEKLIVRVTDCHNYQFAEIHKLWQSLGAIEKRLDHQWEKILDFERSCANAIRILGDKTLTQFGVAEAQLQATGDAVAGEIKDLRGEVGDLREAYDWDLLMELKIRLDEVLATKHKKSGSSKLKRRRGEKKKP